MAKIVLHLGPELDIIRYDRSEVEGGVAAKVASFEKRFNIDFDTLVWFSPGVLKEVHKIEPEYLEQVRGRVEVRRSNTNIAVQASQLSSTAALRRPTKTQRKAYLDALLAIYHTLEMPPTELLSDERVLFLGVKREGKILADKLGWLPVGHSDAPDAKRMSFDGGLFVGLSKLPEERQWKKIAIIDGAIASGATLVAIMCTCAPLEAIHIFSAHATEEGLIAIARVAERLEIPKVVISVGYVSGRLNEDFYAVEQNSRGLSLVVGDLGDTIASLSAD